MFGTDPGRSRRIGGSTHTWVIRRSSMTIEPRRDARLSKRLVSFLMVLFILSLGIGIGTLVSYHVGAMGPGDSQLRIQTDGKPVVSGAVLSLSQAFEEVARRVEPAVVNINTEQTVRLTRGRNGRSRNPRVPQDPQD